MTLLDRHLGFVAALREAGLRVSVSEGLDAAAAVEVVGLADRDVVREVYAATLVKRHQDRPAFDTAFDVFFPAVYGESAAGPGEQERPAPPPWAVDDPARNRLRDRLARYLRDGDDAAAAQLARDAVGNLGQLPGASGGAPTWSRVTTLDRLSAQTLLSGLLESFLAGKRDDDPAAERIARATIADRLARFERMVETDVRRRLAEQQGAEAIARSGTRPSIDRVAFLSATRTEQAALRREIRPLARRLAARLAYVHRHGRRGPLDFRRTIRASLSTGGVPVVTSHRPRRPVRSDLVILCDVSDSVTAFAHFTLMLVYALREQFSRVRAFAFVDEIDEITGFFAPGGDVLDAVERLTSEARVRWVLGRTDYGRVFEAFAERYANEVIGPRTSLLILGDARSNYGDLALRTVELLAKRARHAYWLNPERRSAWDTGDSAASRYGEIVPMLECRNLAQLAEFVQSLA